MVLSMNGIWILGKIYAKLLEQLVNIQAQQIERLQNKLREIEPHKPMNEHHKIRIA